MIRRPLVSIIVASYNHENFVAQAVQSVLDQTIRNIELIVLDDGSTDSTPDIIQQISDPRLKLIRQKHNRRVQLRNLGLALSRGRFIAFQNSDDVWFPEKLERQLEVFHQQKGVIVCFTGVKTIDENNQVIQEGWPTGVYTTQNRSSLEWLNHFFFRGNSLCISSAMLKKKDLQRVGGFRGSLIHISDLDLWIRLAVRGEFHIIPEPLTAFRKVDKGNLSAPSRPNQNRYRIEYADVLQNYSRSPILERIPEIFVNEVQILKPTATLLRVHLAEIAWKHNAPPHRMLADRIMTDILDDPQAREEMCQAFGTEIIKKFYKKRGELRIVKQEH